MQNIRLNDIYTDKTNTGIGDFTKTTVADTDNQKSKSLAQTGAPLRNINIEQPFYMQKDLKDTALDDLNKRLESGMSGLEMKNSMVLAASGMTEQDFSKVKEDGFTPEDSEAHEIVTVADSIRAHLAMAGKDVSSMGGVSDAALKEVAGSQGAAMAVEKAIQQAGLEPDETLISDIKTAVGKAEEISEITSDTKKYLINNNLEPTIENVYKANFSISEKYNYSPTENNVTKEDIDKLMPQIQDIIKNTGYAVDDTTIENARWIVSEKLPLTTDSLRLNIDLNNPVLNTSAEIASTITETVLAGGKPEEAYIIYGMSPTQKAADTVAKLSNITDIQIKNTIAKNDPLTIEAISSQDSKATLNVEESYELISARRQVEELRLSMTYEVSLSMSRRGIAVDTTELSALVDDLKAQEQQLFEILLGDKEGSSNVSLEQKIDIFTQTNSTLEALKSMPAATLGRFSVSTEITMGTLSIEGADMTRKYKAAGESYETLMTTPRADLGDSIKKAFRNVDDILEDLGFDATESNERAVRILGYNSLSITRESILDMRQTDELLRSTFKNLTPGVVAKMVKAGDNPLDLSLEKLNEKIDEIKMQDPSTSSEEGFAEFLYKAEQNKSISDEERAGFIGVYRLIHQVVESDGAVIGALLNQGADVTLRNMMTAIRTDKHKNREAVIDDNFGTFNGFKKDVLSITDQIEMAFQTSRLKDAESEITPYKLASFENEDVYMNMTPDKFATALENMDDAKEEEQQYMRQLQQEMNRAVYSETKVYEELRKFDIPTTPANLAAMQNFLADRNGVYRKVFANSVDKEKLEDIDFNELMGDIFERFGEAVKTPEDMAEAQQKLVETATNVMKNMEVEKEVGYIDVRGMRVAMKQITMLGQIGKEAENYTIPITVADENGTLNLKIVRGSNEENGLVDIAFNMEKTGPVSATFKASANGISGSISCVKDEVLKMLSEMEDELKEKLSDISGAEVSIGFNARKSISDDMLYGDKGAGFDTTNERNQIQTTRLYSMAKSFIDTLGNLRL